MAEEEPFAQSHDTRPDQVVSEGRRLAPFLSPLGAWSYGVGTAIGWGSLVVTSSQYLLRAGPAGSILGIAVGTAIMLAIARNYSYMMKRYPDAGGSYTYVRHVLGNDYGFLLAWFLVLTYTAVFWANATSLPLFSRYFLGNFFQFGYLYTIFDYDVYLGEVLLTMCTIGLIGLLCTRDKRMKQRVMIVLAILFTAGICFCFASSAVMRETTGASFDPAFIPDAVPLMQIAAVSLMTPWAFIGFESISHSTEEFAFSRSKSFRVLLAVIVTTALLYAFVTLLSASAYPERYDSWFAYLSDLGNLSGLEGIPPFYAAYRYLGNAGVTVLLLSLLALVLTSLIGNIVALSRLFVALARDGVVPAAWGRLNRKGTPQRVILGITAISMLIPFLGRTPIGWIVDITTIGACIVYGLVSFSEYRIGRTEQDLSKIATGTVGYVAMIVFGLAILAPSLVSSGSMESETYLLITVWSILGFLYFRILLVRNADETYGNSVVVWAFLLGIVLFCASAWMLQMDQSAAAGSLDSIRAHLQESYPGMDLGDAERYIQDELDALRWANTKSTLVMIGLFAVAIIVMLSNNRFMKKRQDQSNMALGKARMAAYTDPLTGVKNKNAYTEWERGADADVATGKAGELAVIVCDVNGLKFINDTYGHKAGDDYICEACRILCKHFEHSPVYRIGGDEFVVVPQGDDLANRNDVLERFNREIEANVGTTRAVISAGMSILRPGLDRTFHDVFERADARMYQRKMELKGMGAITRD